MKAKAKSAAQTGRTGQRQWLVMKFGGSSVSSARCWELIREQAERVIDSGQFGMIVVSALSGVTNLLSCMAEEAVAERRSALLEDIKQRHDNLLQQLDVGDSPEYEHHWRDLAKMNGQETFPLVPDQRAVLLSFGELLSSALGKQVLEQAGLPVVLQDARGLLQAATQEAPTPLSVRCSDHADPDLEARLAGQGSLHITQGFIAAGPAGETWLLGRGGSDTSATCLAARLQARAVEIWTDVPGMFSADPRVVPDARLLKNLGYREAQELASMGARVLHPPSIQPVRRHRIPLLIRDSGRPEIRGTCISAADPGVGAQVKGVVSRSGITLIHMESPDMWRQPGFLADAFGVFKNHRFSVDLISTSESTVTVSLDPETAVDPGDVRFNALCADLSRLCKLEVRKDCVSISLVGNAIRTILGRISAALDVFHDRHVHLVTQSANDLNLTLVVDADNAGSLVRKLHQLLISSQADGRVDFGPTWTELHLAAERPGRRTPWWRRHAAGLVELLAARDCAYVYHLETVRTAARRLQGLATVDRILYSVKANDNPLILQALAQEGLGFECVSLGEVRHVLQSVPDLPAADILFTPNFAPRREYLEGIRLGVQITVDNSWILYQWPDLFAGREIFLRLDLESGHGHHRKVITSGKDSKFGIAFEHLESLSAQLEEHDIRVTGLHAHTGSGVDDVDVWQEQLRRLLALAPGFSRLRVLDLGGGLGVPDRPGQPQFDLKKLDAVLQRNLGDRHLQIWLEPGRYLVAEAGVLLARVTQMKIKGHYHYAGIATGMNSLIRPALYGSYHEIVNLSRLGSEPKVTYRMVGPICESGDILGESRLLPECSEGDVILIANAGAYGRVMASHYNRRAPAEELFFEADSQ